MADPLATTPASRGLPARFRIWIRRRAEPQGPYSIRFEVTEGKGILRVVRPGVLVDPPARPSGFEERLTTAQVNTSRFLHVWDGGRYRHGHSFARLTEAQLESLPADRWIALDSAAEGTLSMLLLPAVIEPEPARVDDEPTWPRRQMLAELQRELREMEARGADEDRTEVRTVPAGLAPEPWTSPAGDPAGDPAGEGKGSRAERVDIPRGAPAPRAPTAAPARPAFSLDALLEASIPHGPARGMDDEQTVLMGGSALAIDHLGQRAAATVLPRLPPVPRPAEEEVAAIEAAEASEDEGEDFEVVSVESRHALLEALEAHEDEDDDGGPEVTDVGPMPVPESLHRGQLTEAVTVMPPFAQELASASIIGARVNVADAYDLSPASPEDTGNGAIEVGDAGDAEAGEDAAENAAENADAGRYSPEEREDADPHELAPTPAFHERNTTLVRFLRRRIASDRIRIAALERRVADLEGELLRRSAP